MRQTTKIGADDSKICDIVTSGVEVDNDFVMTQSLVFQLYGET